jgi:hypothetical protein
MLITTSLLYNLVCPIFVLFVVEPTHHTVLP